MPSPFPGMNPYLERARVWPEFHNLLVPRFQAQLNPQIRPRYRARVGEHVFLREMPDHVRLVGLPDVSLAGSPRPGPGTATAAAAPATVLLSLPATVEERVLYLEVIDPDGERVVTVIEVLSPSNKYAGDDREQYRRKRNRLIQGGVNYVEIDLLRGGPRAIPDLPPCDYYVCVIRPEELPRAGVWPIRLRDPLPPIPVPLRPGEREPTLDLQAALHAVYDEAGYEDLVYRGDPEPALPPEDAAWAAGLVPRAAESRG